jgi:DNA-binding protein H-NS
MSEFIRIITHARRLKSNVRDLSVEQLQEIQSKLIKIIEDRIIEEQQAQIEEKEKQEKILKYREMIAADGIDLEELQSVTGDRVGKKSLKKAKYEIYNESGQRITWTGQGRMPNLLKARIDEGEPLETFLIE